MVTKRKEGSSRKSKLEHFAVSAAWVDPEYTLDDTLWGELNAVVGRELSPQERQRLDEIITNYFHDHALEAAAPEIKKVRNWLAAIAKAAASFDKILSSPPKPSEVTASAEALNLFEMDIVQPHLLGQKPINKLSAIVMAVLTAAKKSQQRLPMHVGFKGGGAWKGLIYALTDYAAAIGMSPGVSKDETSETSSFVLFVNAIQSKFPSPLRWHPQSLTALAAGITRARAKGVIPGRKGHRRAARNVPKKVGHSPP